MEWCFKTLADNAEKVTQKKWVSTLLPRRRFSPDGEKWVSTLPLLKGKPEKRRGRKKRKWVSTLHAEKVGVHASHHASPVLLRKEELPAVLRVQVIQSLACLLLILDRKAPQLEERNCGQHINAHPL